MCWQWASNKARLDFQAASHYTVTPYSCPNGVPVVKSQSRSAELGQRKITELEMLSFLQTKTHQTGLSLVAEMCSALRNMWLFSADDKCFVPFVHKESKAMLYCTKR